MLAHPSAAPDPMQTFHAAAAAFTPAECARIVALAAEAGRTDAGLVGGIANHNLRRADIAWLDEAEGAGWVMDRLIRLVADANRSAFGFDLTDFAESPQVACYDAARQGHFGWHADIGDGPVARRRKLTLVIQLSPAQDYTGGTLQIMADANTRDAPAEQGSAALFPSFVLHRVTPVTGGTRHSLTVWAHGPAFR